MSLDDPNNPLLAQFINQYITTGPSPNMSGCTDVKLYASPRADAIAITTTLDGQKFRDDLVEHISRIVRDALRNYKRRGDDATSFKQPG